jgi:hypothetical protein
MIHYSYRRSVLCPRRTWISRRRGARHRFQTDEDVAQVNPFNGDGAVQGVEEILAQLVLRISQIRAARDYEVPVRILRGGAPGLAVIHLPEQRQHVPGTEARFGFGALD